jgi:hypothetical protein
MPNATPITGSIACKTAEHYRHRSAVRPSLLITCLVLHPFSRWVRGNPGEDVFRRVGRKVSDQLVVDRELADSNGPLWH